MGHGDYRKGYTYVSDVLDSVEQVTPAWLTDVLTRDGHLGPGQALSVAVTRVHDEQRHSISYFLAASYSPDSPAGAPGRLFLKLPRQDAPLSWVATAGEREVWLYQIATLAGLGPPLIPCYDAAYDPSGPRYHLLLADLSATHDQPAWHLAIAERYIAQTIECLAAFHAYWWRHPRLPSLADSATTMRRQDEVAHLRGAFPEFVDALGDRLDSDGRRIYERLLAALPTFRNRAAEPLNLTLVHGDAHFWNFLYPRDPAVQRTYMLDWQSYHPSLGVQDLAYTMVLRYPHRTPAHERAVVRRYHERLAADGVADYGWDRCWDDYRRAATEQLLVPLLWHATDGLFVARALAAFRDLACDDFLP